MSRHFLPFFLPPVFRIPLERRKSLPNPLYAVLNPLPQRRKSATFATLGCAYLSDNVSWIKEVDEDNLGKFLISFFIRYCATRRIKLQNNLE